jgi:hypothetical protein
MADEYPIKRAIKYTPIWWQDLPQTCPVPFHLKMGREVPTLKKCSGFLSLYKDSWIMPMWSDLIVQTYEDGTFEYQFSNEADWSKINWHPAEQYKGAFNDKIHLKLQCPWRIVEKIGTKFLFTPASWSLFDLQSDLQILPGILDFKYSNTANVNIFAPKKNARYVFKAGQPLIHFVPLTESRVEFKTHAVATEKYLQVNRDTNPRMYNKF